MKPRMSVVATGVVALLNGGCSPSTPESKLSSLPKTTVSQKIDCTGQGFTTKFSAQSQSTPAMVEVTYRGRQPTSVAMEASLRECMQKVLDEKRVTGDLMGHVWWSEEGTEDDDDVQRLTDGSTHLFVRDGSGQIISFKEKNHEVTRVDDRHSYFVEYTELKRLVAPHDTYYDFDVVFANLATEDAAYETLIKEMKRLVGEQKVPLETHGAAFVGTKLNPAGRRQIGRSGNYVYVDFDPKRHGNQLVDGHGKSLGAAATISR